MTVPPAFPSPATTGEASVAVSQIPVDLLFHSHPQPMLLLEASSLDVFSANRAATALYGYTQEEFTARRLSALVGEGKLDALKDFFLHLPSGTPSRFPGLLPLRAKSGSLHPMRVTASRLPPEGRLILLQLSGHAELTSAAEDEGKYRSLFNRINDAVLLSEVTPDGLPGKTLEVNDIACAQYGYTREEFLGLTIFDLNPSSRRHEIPHIASRILTEGKVAIERLHLRKDGEPFPVEIKAHAFELRGQPVFLSVCRDITERNRKEESLRRINRFLTMVNRCGEAILNATDEVQLLQEICGLVVEVGGYEMAWVGYAEHDAEKTVRPLAHAGVCTGYLQSIKVSWGDSEWGRGPCGAAIRSGRPRVVRDIQNDAGFRPWRQEADRCGYRSGIAIPLAFGGAVIGSLNIYSSEADSFDAAEQADLVNLVRQLAYGIETIRWRRESQLAMESLQESEERFRQVAESIDDILLLRDFPSGALLYINSACEKILGLSKAELYTDTSRWSQLILPEFRDTLCWSYDRITEPIECEYRICRRDGEKRWLRHNIFPLRDRAGNIHRIVGIAKDITSVKKAEDQLREQYQQLLQANKMVSLGALVSAVAHEINNPNNYITLNAPLLAEAWEDIRPLLDARYEAHGEFELAGLPYQEEMREGIPKLIASIETGALRIKQLVNDLKDFSRRKEEDHHAVDLNAVLATAIDLIKNQIKSSTRRFRFRPAEELPPICGHFQRLEQVFINLLQNACQSLTSLDEAVEVESACSEAGDMVVIRIRDEGVGIPPENLPRITEPFFTTKRDRGGTGLGLSISAKIIQEHRGTIVFSRPPAGGTEVLVSLPVKAGMEGR